MRIGIDISRTVGQQVGVGRYAQELVLALAQIDKQNSYLLYPYFWHCFQPAGTPFDWMPRQANFKLYTSWIPRRIVFNWMHKTQRPQDWLLGSPDLVHSIAFTSPPLKKSKLIVTMLDMTFETHPQFHFEENIRFCKEQSRLAAMRADMVIAISENTKHDILEILNIPEERIRVIYLGVSSCFRPSVEETKVKETLSKYGIDSQYLLFVGAIEPRKNIAGLVRAYHSLGQELKDNFKLLIVGASGWLNEQIYSLVSELGLQENVKFLGFVPDEDLVFFYNGAAAFVYPSFYEGFGIPVVEAMACGTPVITSDVSSLPEVVGEAGIMVDPQDIEAISDAITSVLTNASLREGMKQKSLDRAKAFSWEQSARQTLAVYKDVMTYRKKHSRFSREV